MAGINNAKQLIKDKKNTGKVLHVGSFSHEKVKIDFMIIKLDKDKGWMHQYAYETSDIQFQTNIKIDDNVKLNIKDGYCAIWEVVEQKVT